MAEKNTIESKLKFIKAQIKTLERNIEEYKTLQKKGLKTILIEEAAIKIETYKDCIEILECEDI